ncbi:MAG: hypothetical protein ACLFQV_06285 [Vulcanimicrobiota bacterium]
MAFICPYCDSKNPDDAEKCRVCQQLFQEDIDFEKPVKKISQLTSKLINKEISADKESLSTFYHDIMNSVQSIMDQSLSRINKNMKNLDELQKQAREQFGDEDFEAFKDFIEEFEVAQNQINQGMNIAKSRFFEADSFEELEKGQLDLSMAVGAIQDGLAKLEELTCKSEEPELMSPSPFQMPFHIIETTEILDEVISDLNSYTETGELDYLNRILESLDKARLNILRVIETTKKEQEEMEMLEGEFEEEYDQEFEEEIFDEEDEMEKLYEEIMETEEGQAQPEQQQEESEETDA